MTSNPSGQGFQNKNRVAILAELDKEKRKLLMQNQSSTNHPGANISLARSSLNKDFRDHAEQQHIAAQQKAALQPKKMTLHSVRPRQTKSWTIVAWKLLKYKMNALDTILVLK
ncbi:SOSS complex subunit C isoform X1 [Pituophis catenifer annectens]|uniref:SOSS complex subunit C isoform X1 n=1 Tax=Pituophis catenifer annectens TaxID=94852 RepID=UPI00399142FE